MHILGFTRCANLGCSRLVNFYCLKLRDFPSQKKIHAIVEHSNNYISCSPIIRLDRIFEQFSLVEDLFVEILM